MRALSFWGLILLTGSLFFNVPLAFSAGLVIRCRPPCFSRSDTCSNIGNNDAGSVKGTVKAVAVGSGIIQTTPLAGAVLTLTNKATPSSPSRTMSNASGSFFFDNLPAGEYVLTVDANGLNAVTKEISLPSGAALTIDIEMSATINESITIRDEEGLLSTSETATSNVVRSETLKTQPIRTETFDGSISLTPGVVHDGNGNNYLKGTRAGQSAYTVNGADVTDPGTGKLAFEMPLEATDSVQIQENPYSAEFGRFTGGVTNIQTKGGGDKFRISVDRFFPTLHNIFSTTVDSFRPRVTFGGPIAQKKLYFLQSFEYRFTRSFVTSLPKTNNDITLEGVNSFTQLDWTINKTNSLKFNLAIFPQKIQNLTLDTFNPVPSTPNYKQRGLLFSTSEQAVFKDASFLLSTVSYKTFDVDVFAKSDLPFNLTPERNTGGYFADSRRQTKRIQWQETYYSRPLKFGGDHSIKAGIEYDQTKIGGRLRYSSIFIRRLDGTLAQRIDFTDTAPIDHGYAEAAAFVQDRWVISPRITVDYGARFDLDGVTGSKNLAPRVSFLFLPFNNGMTIVRGGAGIFYDRSLAAAGYFDRAGDGDTNDASAELEQAPERIVTNFAANGTTVVDGPRLFETRTVSTIRTPRSFRWSLQLDRELTRNLIARVGYLERFTSNDLLIEPVAGFSNTGELVLASNGRSRYDEFQVVAVYTSEKLGRWNASYVFSRARGDSNTADKYFSDTPAFVVRPNEYGRLPFDSPHRFLFYGQVDISKKHDIRVAPLVELRSGFPFSKVDERLNFVGPQNEAGRFPTFFSLDVQVTKGFQVPFFKDRRMRVGVALFNLTNHFNPRDVQTNITSPNYGRFYNSLGVSSKLKIDFDF